MSVAVYLRVTDWYECLCGDFFFFESVHFLSIIDFSLSVHLVSTGWQNNKHFLQTTTSLSAVTNLSQLFLPLPSFTHMKGLVSTFKTFFEVSIYTLWSEGPGWRNYILHSFLRKYRVISCCLIYSDFQKFRPGEFM